MPELVNVATAVLGIAAALFLYGSDFVRFVRFVGKPDAAGWSAFGFLCLVSSLHAFLFYRALRSFDPWKFTFCNTSESLEEVTRQVFTHFKFTENVPDAYRKLLQELMAFGPLAGTAFQIAGPSVVECEWCKPVGPVNETMISYSLQPIYLFAAPQVLFPHIFTAAALLIADGLARQVAQSVFIYVLTFVNFLMEMLIYLTGTSWQFRTEISSGCNLLLCTIAAGSVYFRSARDNKSAKHLNAEGSSDTIPSCSQSIEQLNLLASSLHQNLGSIGAALLAQTEALSDNDLAQTLLNFRRQDRATQMRIWSDVTEHLHRDETQGIAEADAAIKLAYNPSGHARLFLVNKQTLEGTSRLVGLAAPPVPPKTS